MFEPRTTLNLDVEYVQSSTSSGRSSFQGHPLHSQLGQPGLYKTCLKKEEKDGEGRVGENKYVWEWRETRPIWWLKVNLGLGRQFWQWSACPPSMLSQSPRYTFKQKQGGSKERQGPGTHRLANLTYLVSTGPVRNNKVWRLLRMNDTRGCPLVCAHMCTSLPAQKKCKVAPPLWKYLGSSTKGRILTTISPLAQRELNTKGHATNCMWVFRAASFIVAQRWKWPKFSLILELSASLIQTSLYYNERTFLKSVRQSAKQDDTLCPILALHVCTWAQVSEYSSALTTTTQWKM